MGKTDFSQCTMNRFYFDREENAYQLKEENEKLMLEINRLSNVPKKLSTSSFTSKPPNFSDLIKDLSICNSKTKSLWSKDEKSEVHTNQASSLSSLRNVFSTNLNSGEFFDNNAGDRPCPRYNTLKAQQNITPFEGFNTSNMKVQSNSNIRTEQVAKEKRRMDERLIGEIAFQLDKRILHNVFSTHKRLYGFNVRNISEKIDEYTRDFSSGAVEIEKRENLRAKRDATIKFLSRAAHYDIKKHALMCEKLINRFGVLRVGSTRGKEEYRSVMTEKYLKSAIMSTIEPESTYDTLIILNSLLAFAKLDGKSLFLW